MKKKTPHIVHIIPFLQHGAGRAVVNVIRGFSERDGGRQTLVTAGARDDLHDDASLLAEAAPHIGRLIVTEVFKRDAHALTLSARKIANAVRKDETVILHANTGVSCLCALQARALLPAGVSCRVVTTLMGGSPDKLHFYKEMDAWAANQCDAVLPISNAVKRIMAVEGVRDELMRTVYCGLFLDEIKDRKVNRKSARVALGLEPGARVAGYAGQLSARKGLDTLLKAFSSVSGNNPDARLLLIGDGPERNALSKLAASLKISDRVIFAGRVQDVYAAISAMDVLVLPSVYEGLGLVLIEAQALGVPVVATDSGGASETFRHNYSGFLVHTGDTRALAKKIELLLNDKKLARAFGRAGSRFVLKKFDIRSVVYELDSVYADVLSHPPRRETAPAP